MLLIDKLSSKPVYEQIVEGIERNILLGLYPVGGQVPSVRELSVSLGINPNTIQKSYAELARRGVICPSPGNGCFVAADAKERMRERAVLTLDGLRKTVRDMRMAGVTRDEILKIVNDAMEEEP